LSIREIPGKLAALDVEESLDVGESLDDGESVRCTFGAFFFLVFSFVAFIFRSKILVPFVYLLVS